MVSVIILSYNTKHLLRDCLSAATEKLKNIPHEIIVFDNNSQDGSLQMVKHEFPTVKRIASNRNLGFARGVNRAAEKAKGKYLLLLNSDATLLDSGICDLTALLDADETIAIVGGMLITKDGATSESYGKFYLLPEVFRLLFLRKKAHMREKREVFDVDWVSGGFMLIRKSIFAAFSGFDERFFMYIEDMELCYRLKKKQYRIIYSQQAKAKHVGQGSSNRTFAIVQIFKGIVYFYKKHRPLHEQVIVHLLLVTKSVVSYLFGVATNNSFLKVTYAQTLRNLL